MPTTIRSAEEMVKRVMLDPATLEKVKADPVPALQDLAKQVLKDNPPGPAYQSDKWLYRIVVSTLGLTVLSGILGSLYLATLKLADDTPQVVVALGSAAVGALAGLLAPSPGQRSQ